MKNDMKDYDIIVIGSGSGIIVVNEALAHGLQVALIDKGPIGGTCLNLGCVPSKMLISPADRIIQVQESVSLGLTVRIESIDFLSIMERMRQTVIKGQEQLRYSILKENKLDYYNGTASFIEENMLQVADKTLRGRIFVIASGARPFLPPIKGLESSNYLTNESVLQLNEKPESILIIGGGYIAVEYAHFFAAMGTRVTIIEMAERLVPLEEPEVSELLRNELSQRMEIYTHTLALECMERDGGYMVQARNLGNDQLRQFFANKIMIASGRISNSDLLNLSKTGVQVDDKGFIKVDDFLETTRKYIFAVGDINGKQMFTHAANREALLVANHIMHGLKVKMNFQATPHAIFTHPQIASVGLTEAEARKNYQILIGRASYHDQVMGMAMMNKTGFAKAIVEKTSGKLLGFHIIGPEAAILIQEVANTMAQEGTINDIHSGMHIHPALSEVVQSALSHLGEQ